MEEMLETNEGNELGNFHKARSTRVDCREDDTLSRKEGKTDDEEGGNNETQKRPWLRDLTRNYRE
jgi:hypothetical protein